MKTRPPKSVLRQPRLVPVDSLKEHPEAHLVPDMRPIEWADFYQDVSLSGIRDPIEVTGDGVVLDGRHRLRAAKEMGLTEIAVVDAHLNGNDPAAYMLKAAITRRSITDDQRAMIAAMWAERNAKPVEAGPGRGHKTAGQRVPAVSDVRHPTRTAAAQTFNVATEKVKDATTVLRKDRAAATQVLAGDVSLKDARKAAREKPVKPEQVVQPPPARPVSTIRIICGDSTKPETYQGVTADLVIFSPPYNVGIDYRGGNEADYPAGNDSLPHSAWCQLLADVGRNIREQTNAARVCVNFPMGIGRNPYKPLLPDVLLSFTEYEVEGIIIWDKMTTGNRTSWGSWRKPSAPRLRDRTELVVVFNSKKPTSVPPGTYDTEGFSPWLSAAVFTELTQDLWKVSPAQRNGHPAPFPVELPERLIRLFGWPGCTVLDPFAGSGTTAVAAQRLGANAVMIEKSSDYCAYMVERLKQ